MSIRKNKSRPFRHQQAARLIENLESRRVFSIAATHAISTDYSDSTVVAVDNAGQEILQTDDGQSLLYSGGSYTALQSPAGDPLTASAINDNGEIVGYYQNAVTNKQEAFSLVGGTFTPLGDLGGAAGSYATAVNDNGDIAGDSSTPDDSYHPFIYSGGTMTDIGLLPGATFGQSFDISDAGDVTGIDALGGGYESFLYSGGQLKDAGAFDDGTDATATDSNNAGVSDGDPAETVGVPASVDRSILTVTAAPVTIQASTTDENNSGDTTDGDTTDGGQTDNGQIDGDQNGGDQGDNGQGDNGQGDNDPSDGDPVGGDQSGGDQSGGGQPIGEIETLTPVPGVAASSVISGTVYKDSNRNGKQDAGETGLGGVNVFAGSNGFTTTAADGSYSIALAPGSYSTFAGTPGGYTATSDPIATLTVTAGKATIFDVAEAPSAAGAGRSTINGTIFNDANGNGVQDGGEAGAQGVTVTLTQTARPAIVRANAAVAPVTVKTDASGHYSFTGLAAGSYTVADAVPAGDTQTAPATGHYNVSIGLAGSQTISGENFGLKANAAPVTHYVTGTVFNDANHNGKQDAGETGLAGVTLTLTPTRVAVFAKSDAATSPLTIKSDASGNFDFTSVPNGGYTLTQTLLSGYTQTVPAGGGYTFLLEDRAGVSGELFGQYKKPVVVPPATGSISGTVFNDANGNGTKDAGEGKLSGVTVFLTEQAGGIVTPNAIILIATTTTNSSGGYSFTGIAPGTYKLGEETLDGYTQTVPSADAGYTVTLVAGQTVAGETFAQHKTAVTPPPSTGTITGTLFNDTDGDGLQDNGEAATGVRTVFIDTNGNGKLDPGEQSTQSDASGKYAFTGVAAGQVKISRLFPAGFHLSNASAGTNGLDVVATVLGGATATADLGTHQNITHPIPASGTIAGTLFNDTDGDGKLDHGEVATGVRTVFIDANQNGKLDPGERSTTSDVHGTYSFSSIIIGTVAISRLFPAGFYLSDASAGTNGNDVLVRVLGGLTVTADLGTHQNA